jgi:phage terminase small subunit
MTFLDEDVLTAKQASFVENYLIDLNATQAAIRAGYSKRTAAQQGFENLRKPEIQAALTAAMTARSKRTQLEQDWIIERLMAVVERSMQAEPVRDHEGNETGEYTFQASGANRGLELLGKHLGMFVERHEVGNNVRVLSDKPLTVEEWEERYCTGGGGEPTDGD